MNRVGDIETRGRVLFADSCIIAYDKHSEDGNYCARVSLIRYEINSTVEQRVNTRWVPEPYLMALSLRGDANPDCEPVIDSTLVLDAGYNDSQAIRLAISRFGEMISHADEAIAEWRMDQGLDKPETA